MGIVLRYSDPNGVEEPSTLVAVASNTRFGTLSFSNNAMVGEAAVSNVTIEDPGGIYSFVGLRAFDVRESSAPSNNSVIGRFAVQDRKVSRSPEHALIVGASRQWTLDLVDYNWHLGKRILTDSDAKRPDETAGDRIRWLLKSAAHFALYDYGYVTYPSDQMEACDYRGQRPLDLLADCAVESGYNFWCDYNEAHGRPELFFMDPGSGDYPSNYRISNVLSDIDSTTTFAPYEDAELTRSATKIAYGVYLAYEGGSVYVRKDVTGEQFAKLDQSAPMSNVKKKARARRIANHFLNDNDEEDDMISVSIKMPLALVNGIRHGQLVNVRFSHLPGYESFTPVRVLRRSVIQEDEGGTDHYRLQLELSPSGSAAGVAVPDVKWIFYKEQGGIYQADVQASDDGASWSTILTAAQLAAGTVNPPNVTPGTYGGIVAVPEADWSHRYWRLNFVWNFAGGFFGGAEMSIFRLLSGSDYAAVDRLRTPSSGFPTLWWEAIVGTYPADIEFNGACALPILFTFAAGGGFTAVNDRQGVGKYGVGAAVLGAQTITATFDFDLLEGA